MLGLARKAGRHAPVATCLVLGLLLVGCGGSGSESVGDSVNDADGSAVVGDPPGVDSGGGQTGAGASAPDVSGIGVPLAPSAAAVGTMKSGPITIVQFTVPLDEQQSTISFYDDWTAGQPEEYLRTAAESGGVSWQNDPDPGEERCIISVLSPLEGDDFVAVTLTVGPAE